MDYLKKFGLSDTDIEEISNNLTEDEYQTIEFYKSRVSKDIDYLKELGITDIKGIFMNCAYIFNYFASELKEAIEKCEVPNIIELLREDVSNFELV